MNFDHLQSVNWDTVFSTALSGIVSVFAVLFIVMVFVQLAGMVLGSFAKKP